MQILIHESGSQEQIFEWLEDGVEFGKLLLSESQKPLI